MDAPQAFYALILSPTRELAIQIAEQVEALGAASGVRCAVLVGGVDTVAQAVALARRPHVVVGTPGRVVDHLSNTKVRERERGEEREREGRFFVFSNNQKNAPPNQQHTTASSFASPFRASPCAPSSASSWTKPTACSTWTLRPRSTKSSKSRRATA
jgi:hypothetical protein